MGGDGGMIADEHVRAQLAELLENLAAYVRGIDDEQATGFDVSPRQGIALRHTWTSARSMDRGPTRVPETRGRKTGGEGDRVRVVTLSELANGRPHSLDGSGTTVIVGLVNEAQYAARSRRPRLGFSLTTGPGGMRFYDSEV